MPVTQIAPGCEPAIWDRCQDVAEVQVWAFDFHRWLANTLGDMPQSIVWDVPDPLILVQQGVIAEAIFGEIDMRMGTAGQVYRCIADMTTFNGRVKRCILDLTCTDIENQNAP